MNTCRNLDCQQKTKSKYCSKSCAATTNNRLFPKRKRVSGVYECLVCDTRLLEHQRKYCSRKCNSAYNSYAILVDFIEGYSGSSLESGKLSAPARTCLLETADHSCTLCGWNTPNPITGSPILTVDHIDGNWKNNHISNLRVICYNCHTLTETFGSLNVGSVSGRRDYQFNRP